MNTKQIEYSARLRHPQWQRRRLEIMARDQFTCRECYDTETTLNVHHRYYVAGRAPWEYPDDVLVTLCEPCHEVETRISHLVKASAFTLIGVTDWATHETGSRWGSRFGWEPEVAIRVKDGVLNIGENNGSHHWLEPNTALPNARTFYIQELAGTIRPRERFLVAVGELVSNLGLVRKEG